MTLNEIAVSYRSVADINAALQALTDVGRIRLHKIAGTLARTYPVEVEDLLHEAFCRALDGRRRCPSNVDLFKFFAETMRSISSDTLKAEKRHPTLYLVSNTDGEENAYDPPDEYPNAEETLVREQEASRIKQEIIMLFEDDPVAQVMVEGKMEDMDGEELRALTDLNMTAFASKQKLIRRRIKKAFPEGWIDL